MKVITVSELKQRATQIISELESTKEEVIVTKNGKAVAWIQYFSENEFNLIRKENEKGKESDKRGKRHIQKR